MKKIYLMGLSVAFAMSVNAQNSIKTKNPSNKGEFKNAFAAKGGSPISPLQITGGITCSTQYVAGTTMNLVFSLDLTNIDSEYGDLVSITFPAGITPNTSASNTASVGTGVAYIEILNPIAGQTIYWGDNDNTYGGIVPGISYSLQVNVTIGAGITGNQMATINVSGDTYGGASAGDLVGGSCTIYPSGSTVVNMRVKYAQPSMISAINNCGLGIDQIYTRIYNNSSNVQSNFPVNYSVNGVASTATVLPGPLAAGDSIDFYLPNSYDFSASNIYMIKTWVAQAGDINMTNDTAALTISNSVSVPLTSATYTNGVESLYEYGSVNRTSIGTGLAFAADNTDMHSGALSFNYNIPTTLGAPAGTYTAVNVYPCVDIVNGETYRITWWNKVDGTPVSNGMIAITAGSAQTSASTSTVLKPYTAITPGVWAKDSADYVATVSGTRYFAIRGKGTLSATSAVSVKTDDLLIYKIVGSAGVKTIAANDAITIFPNPTSGILNINAVEANSSVEVFNVIGDKVYTNVFTKGNNTVDLSRLADGAYFVKLNSNNQIITKKVVLSK
ncbi:MAG: T9SS type A sorting domain-containing protein [Burkholderiales bacterium]|nr:T9SS type A sorting domain-containing protein [Bacteroidia bacterium]